MDYNIIIASEGNELTTETMKSIAELKHLEAVVKDAVKKLNEDLKAYMVENGLKKIESEDISISYIEPTTRETLDTKKLKAECPDIYDEYVKFTDVADSLRFKAK